MILLCWLAAAKYGKKVAVLDYVSPSPQGREIIILLMTSESQGSASTCTNLNFFSNPSQQINRRLVGVCSTGAYMCIFSYFPVNNIFKMP